MSDKLKKYLKIFVVVVIVALFIWFIILWPMYTFKKDEKTLENAAKRYYELNKTELPTGSRIATISMQTLYHKAYLKEDFYIPYTETPCSLKESWVKVKKENGKYKYYTYLKCGALESNIDNKGPEITLNGSESVIVNVGEEYKEPGVKSVVDNTDKKLKTSVVTIDKDKVDTNKIGDYEVTYTAFDSLKNKTTVTRTVKVVSKLKNLVNTETNKTGYYVGEDPKNYVMLSGMLFRIIGVEEGNVKVVAEEDVANVNYAGINDWLDYYMEHINESSKKILVKNKYCNMKLTDSTLNATECTTFTKERYAYIPSITDINKSTDATGSFLKPRTLSWTSNTKDNETSYATRNMFFGANANKKFYGTNKELNFGVRPVLTIKGDTLIKSGDGTITSPYTFGETPKAKIDDKINTRYPGEYIEYGGALWRIIDINEDGTTKVISYDNIKKDGVAVEIKYETSSEKKIYKPTEKGNVGYYINNKVSEFIDTSYFVNKEISVPIYKDYIQYNKQTTTKKYKVKLSAPNMYEMFSTSQDPKSTSYWLINSTNKKYFKGVVSDAGIVFDSELGDYTPFGIRVVGNFNKSVAITKGNGTLEKPYEVTK